MGTDMAVERGLRRGVSELVIVLALIAIIIPIVMVLQGWLSSRAGSLEGINVIQPLSGYVISRTYTDGREVITIGLRNQGQTSYEVKGFKAVLVNGSVRDVEWSSSTAGTVLEPGSERVFVITVSSGSTRVKSIVVTASEIATGKRVETSINL